MPRDSKPGRNVRARIADIAARLISSDGVDDFALAKRKAARQIGVTDNRNLPTNEEIEAALGVYRQLYQADEHPLRITHLRENALEMMHELQRFNPKLSGAVLDGSAGRYCSIELHLFTDSAKEVELYLLNGNMNYRPGQRRVYRGAEQDTVPVFEVFTDEADFKLSVFSPLDLRVNLCSTPKGRPFRHAGPKTVEEMLAR